jgi:hypothetical protein
MLSTNGHCSLPALSEIFRSLSSHQVPLVGLRIEVDGVNRKIPAGFNPAFLEGIFQSFPALEELCLDQKVERAWPKPWVSNYVKKLSTLSHTL